MKTIIERGTRKVIAKFAPAFLLGAALACHFSGGTAGAVGVPVFTLGALVLLLFRFPFFRHSAQSAASYPDSETESGLPHQARKDVEDSVSLVPVDALGSPFRKKYLEHTEEEVNALIDECIKLLRMRINAHSIAVFFQTSGDSFKMRRHWSQSEYISPEAVLNPGVGVLGGLFKNGLKTLNLQEIMNDSTTLYYYSRDAGVRSLIACPIAAGNADRGVIIADSTEKRAFTDEQITFVSTIATVLGHAAYNAYLCFENTLEYKRLKAVSTIEKRFFQQHPSSVDSILDILTDIIPFAFSCDRLTISMASEDKDHATIKRTYGLDSDTLLLKQFPLDGKTLVAIFYTKNISHSRNFAHDRYEVRYFEKEPKNNDLASFLAVPIGVDDCKGMVLLESFKPDAFSDADRSLLSKIATSAGLAIEKVLILEKANNLATRDGLTGLCNHRQFQIKLKEEIVRSKRQNYPLALAIGDIDFFKKINDTYGHPFGDLVLKNVAGLLETSIRQEIDTAARYGGEEFALILVETNEAQARETAERIRATIEKSITKNTAKGDVRVTMSFGIAILGQHATDLSELIQKADRALYRAKETGRNRVEVF